MRNQERENQFDLASQVASKIWQVGMELSGPEDYRENFPQILASVKQTQEWGEWSVGWHGFSFTIRFENRELMLSVSRGRRSSPQINLLSDEHQVPLGNWGREGNCFRSEGKVILSFAAGEEKGARCLTIYLGRREAGRAEAIIKIWEDCLFQISLPNSKT